MEEQFVAVVQFIKESRNNAIKSVNTELINLYWNVGGYINQQVSKRNWGEKTVDELARFIGKNHPELKGFNRRGLYRMKQFYETYINHPLASLLYVKRQSANNQLDEIVSSPMTQLGINDIRGSILVKISWTHHLVLMSRVKSNEEKEFYLRLCIKENYSVKQLERQINSGLFERTMIGNTKLSPLVREIPDISNSLKDSYIFEFLNLPKTHSESDLQKGLVGQMKNFILELGKDFLFMGEEYRVQVGNSDFYLDLLFYHRGLQCLVNFELKNDKFKPEYLGKLNFYLEALDQDVKKPHENPSIGILLCNDKDSEVVKYAMNRSLSPTMVAEYKTQLPDKKLLQDKLQELIDGND
jgi:predicted nuclease of restriction endonuclease-like (RecB) superfamily